MVYTKYITFSTLTYLFFTGFRGLLRDSAGPPPSMDTDTDHSQPVPEDDKLDSRPDQAAMESAYIKRLEVQEEIGAVLSRLPVPRKVDQTGISVTAAMKQVCCSAWRTTWRRRVTSSPLKCICTMPKIAGVLILDIFGLILVHHGISLQLDCGGAKGSNCAALTARIQSS